MTIDIDATSSVFFRLVLGVRLRQLSPTRLRQIRGETPRLAKHPIVFNETSAIQLMSGQNALINGDQLFHSQLNSPAITQRLPPPYTYIQDK